MASTFNSIAALVSDDTGTPEAPNGDGTQINSSLFAAIDAILNEFLTRSAKTIGGVVMWETPGSHTFQGSTTAANELFVSNTNAGTASIARFRLGNNANSSLGALWATSSTASEPNALRLDSSGAGGIRISVSATAPISLSGVGGGVSLPANVHDTFALSGFNIVTTTVFHNNAGQGSGNDTGFLIGENINTFSSGSVGTYGVQGNATLPSWALDLGGARGNSGSPWNADAFTILRRPAAGSWVRMMTLGLLNGFPNLMVGRGALSTIGGVTIGEGTGTPVSGQILFGGDGSGWQLRIGRNNAGTVSHYWIFDDSGHLRPNGHSVNNIGAAGGNSIGTIYSINGEFGGSILVAGGVTTGATNPITNGTGNLGNSGAKWGAIWALDSNFGDVSFDNQWSITEGEKVGLPHGLAFVRADQELCMFIDERGTLYVEETQPLWKIRQSYRKMTKQERLGAS
jgi:hypothetical protein